MVIAQGPLRAPQYVPFSAFHVNLDDGWRGTVGIHLPVERRDLDHLFAEAFDRDEPGHAFRPARRVVEGLLPGERADAYVTCDDSIAGPVPFEVLLEISARDRERLIGDHASAGADALQRDQRIGPN